MLQKSQEASSVVLISHSPSIITLSDEILQGVERYLVVHVVKVDLELPAADSQVTLSKFIGNVPSQSSVLPSFLDESVEEAKTVDQLLERLGMEATFVKFLIADWIDEERHQQVVLQAFSRFIRHLQ